MHQLEYWNDYAGESWARNAGGLEGLNAALGARALDVAAAQPGEHVIDVGCGTGATTLALAEQVGPTGRVLGMDLSSPMIEVARQLRAEAGMRWVGFMEADVETAALVADSFDLAFSRMCLMLLDDPVRGARTIAGALRHGGRLVATTFRSAADNPWLPLVVMGAVPYLDGLPPLPLPGEPGPFAFADPARPHHVFTEAGFVDVHVEPLDTVMKPDGAPEDVAGLLIQLGPAGGSYLRAAEDRQAAARAGVLKLLAAYRDGDGQLSLPNGSWLITARRP